MSDGEELGGWGAEARSELYCGWLGFFWLLCFVDEVFVGSLCFVAFVTPACF